MTNLLEKHINTKKEFQELCHFLKNTPIDDIYYYCKEELGCLPNFYIHAVFKDEFEDLLNDLHIRYDYYYADDYYYYTLWPEWLFLEFPPKNSPKNYLEWIEKNFGLGGFINYTEEIRNIFYKLLYQLTRMGGVELDTVQKIIQPLYNDAFRAQIQELLEEQGYHND